MRRHCSFSALVMIVGLILLPRPAAPQLAPPLTATIFFKNAPANVTFDAVSPATPITIVVQIENTSGAAVLTTEDFLASVKEAWRRLYFTREDGGIVTNTAEEAIHGDARVGFCLSRKGVLQVPTAIPVVPIGFLDGPPQPFSIELTVDDARKYFDLKKPGRHTATVRLPVLTYQFGGAIITDCDQFPDTALANVGDAAGLSRQQFQIVSNSLEFFVQAGDTTPPTTTAARSPAANGAGWNNQNVTLTFTATDNVGGSGVNRIEVNLTGAQSLSQTFAGASGAVTVTAEGITNVSFRAIDTAGNAETIQTQTVRIDRTPPTVTPPAPVTVVATERGGARGSASPALATFLSGGSATDNLDPSPNRLAPQVAGSSAANNTFFPLGTTGVTFRFQDVAGNIGSGNSSVRVVPGAPDISGSIVRRGSVNKTHKFYDLKFTNTGTGIAFSVVVKQFTFATLKGQGKVTYDKSRSPDLPIALGDLAPGASKTIRVQLIVPPPVEKFSLTESGTLQNAAGQTLSFSTSQVVSVGENEANDD